MSIHRHFKNEKLLHYSVTCVKEYIIVLPVKRSTVSNREAIEQVSSFDMVEK